MGMPISVEIIGAETSPGLFDKVYDYFQHVDNVFSTYKPESEISRINRGEIVPEKFSEEMQTVLRLCEETKKETGGFFDIKTPQGNLDPSGLVKGWAILNAAKILKNEGVENFYIDAGGDIQPSGRNAEGKAWRLGIKNPFKQEEIIKVIHVHDQGVATSGTYIRGAHIYNPKSQNLPQELVSLTVIGPDVYEADRFATAAFAMGMDGLEFITNLKGFEAYGVDPAGMAHATSGFVRYTKEA